MRLGGWQRLWIVLSVVAITPVAFVVLAFRAPADKPEDPAAYARLLEADVTIVEIETIGEVRFPSDLSEQEITRLVKQAMSSAPPTVRTVAADHLRQRAERKAAEAKAENAAARKENLLLYAYGAATWLAFASLLYVAGWSVGWIRRGFKAT